MREDHEDEIIIRTPQFMGSQDKFDWTEQSGTIDRSTMIFTPNGRYHKGRVGIHRVHFNNDMDVLAFTAQISEEQAKDTDGSFIKFFENIKTFAPLGGSGEKQVNQTF